MTAFPSPTGFQFGAAAKDGRGPSWWATFAHTPGRCRDTAHVNYLAGHLAACARALAEGVPLDAYLAWSLMDNFEWGRGYTQRFGLVHVDYATQRRTPKDSALAYRDFIGDFIAEHGR